MAIGVKQNSNGTWSRMSDNDAAVAAIEAAAEEERKRQG